MAQKVYGDMKEFEDIIILNADGIPDQTGHSIKIKNVKVPATVPVYFGNSFDEASVGYANLRVKDEQVIGDVILDLDEVPENLKKRYPSIIGFWETHKRIGLAGVLISVSNNLDTRIKSIEEQTELNKK